MFQTFLWKFPNTSFTFSKLANASGWLFIIFINAPICRLFTKQTTIYLSVSEYIPCTYISDTPCLSLEINSADNSFGELVTISNL